MTPFSQEGEAIGVLGWHNTHRQINPSLPQSSMGHFGTICLVYNIPAQTEKFYNERGKQGVVMNE
jgi:hypothetical protein